MSRKLGEKMVADNRRVAAVFVLLAPTILVCVFMCFAMAGFGKALAETFPQYKEKTCTITDQTIWWHEDPSQCQLQWNVHWKEHGESRLITEDGCTFQTKIGDTQPCWIQQGSSTSAFWALPKVTTDQFWRRIIFSADLILIPLTCIGMYFAGFMALFIFYKSTPSLQQAYAAI